MPPGRGQELCLRQELRYAQSLEGFLVILHGGARRDEVEKMEGIVGGTRRGRADPKRGSPKHPSKGDSIWTGR